MPVRSSPASLKPRQLSLFAFTWSSAWKLARENTFDIHAPPADADSVNDPGAQCIRCVSTATGKAPPRARVRVAARKLASLTGFRTPGGQPTTSSITLVETS